VAVEVHGIFPLKKTGNKNTKKIGFKFLKKLEKYPQRVSLHFYLSPKKKNPAGSGTFSCT
jgi:hypothetical protein